jgi:catechol 2,3-dioxygenase-like lactoylglutathione lyase family enzyme
MLDIWHVACHVADLDRSIAFYCGGLGFVLVGRDEEAAFISLGEGGFTIELMAAPAGKAASGPGAPDHVAFATSDLDAYRETLIKAGLSIPEIQVVDIGLKRFSLEDPDGLQLDFFQGRQGFEGFIFGDRRRGSVSPI